LSTICTILTIPGKHIVIDQVLPLLGDSAHVLHRQGAAEMINCELSFKITFHSAYQFLMNYMFFFNIDVVQSMDSKILPYVIFLIVPILGRMSDPDEHIRLVSTNCFAHLIKLVPLEVS